MPQFGRPKKENDMTEDLFLLNLAMMPNTKKQRDATSRTEEQKDFARLDVYREILSLLKDGETGKE